MSFQDVIILKREDYGQDGTFGQLYFDGESIACTCELPWKENKNDVSCIPNGVYGTVPHNSAVHPNTWEVLVEGRTGILIHAGNTIEDTQGCILVGDSFGTIDGKDAVINSVATIKSLREILPKDGFTLRVMDAN